MNAFQTSKNPPAGVADGLDKASLPGGIDEQVITPNANVLQAQIDLIADEVVDSAGWLIDQLNCLPAQRAAGDIVGMIYSLRRARAYWLSTSGSAKELVERNDERLSALRQSEGGQ
jgi:hypothetical protein